MSGKEGVKKLKNHNLSWFTIVCFLEAGTFEPLREEPKDLTESPKKPDPPLSTKTHRDAENKDSPAEHAIIAAFQPEQKNKQAQVENCKTQQDFRDVNSLIRAQLGFDTNCELPSVRKRLGDKNSPEPDKKRKMKLDESIDFGMDDDFNFFAILLKKI